MLGMDGKKKKKGRGRKGGDDKALRKAQGAVKKFKEQLADAKADAAEGWRTSRKARR